MIDITLPLRTPNPLNGSHGHWSVKAKLRKGHRLAAALALRLDCRQWGRERTNVYIRVTRVAPSRGLDPWDGLGASLKGVIDGIADALGCDDHAPWLHWQLRQERGPWGVRIQIHPTGTARSDMGMTNNVKSP